MIAAIRPSYMYLVLHSTHYVDYLLDVHVDFKV